jgi:hypothetical protein
MAFASAANACVPIRILAKARGAALPTMVAVTRCRVVIAALGLSAVADSAVLLRLAVLLDALGEGSVIRMAVAA